MTSGATYSRLRIGSRRDSKIPQACPAGYLCFAASQSEMASKDLGSNLVLSN